MKLNLSADDVLATTRSVRKRLDFDRPVERDIVLECLELALQAPTGSNSQGWQWVFVEDQAKKDRLAEIYRRNFDLYRSAPRATYDAGDTRGERMDAVVDSASYLSDNFERSPLMMIPCIRGRVDSGAGGSASAAGMWGSILPAVWSMMLALRERGMGSAWTTIHLMNDGEREAAELLGIPHDTFTQAGLFPIAYTQGTDFKPAKRLPAEELCHWDTW
ncbi:MAG: nitroreductase family protein [Ilumatobacteraceae bacterium]